MVLLYPKLSRVFGSGASLQPTISHGEHNHANESRQNAGCQGRVT